MYLTRTFSLGDINLVTERKINTDKGSEQTFLHSKDVKAAHRHCHRGTQIRAHRSCCTPTGAVRTKSHTASLARTRRGGTTLPLGMRRRGSPQSLRKLRQLPGSRYLHPKAEKMHVCPPRVHTCSRSWKCSRTEAHPPGSEQQAALSTRRSLTLQHGRPDVLSESSQTQNHGGCGPALAESLHGSWRTCVRTCARPAR